MRKVVLALIVWLVPAAVATAGVPGRFIQTPDISGNTIVFTLGARPVDRARHRRHGPTPDEPSRRGG